jgi:hypothetical protein
MIYIAHRGNLYGPEPDEENRISYLRRGLVGGFMVEADVRFVDGEWWTGHDEPIDEIPKEMLTNQSILWHAKTRETAEAIIGNDSLRDFMHWFWHEDDHFCLTSRGWLLSHALREPVSNCIQVSLTSDEPADGVMGICSDFVGKLRRD